MQTVILDKHAVIQKDNAVSITMKEYYILKKIIFTVCQNEGKGKVLNGLYAFK